MGLQNKLDDWLDSDMIVLEPRSFRTTFFDILDDIDTSELLEIAAHDTFVVTQLVSERANRVRIVFLQVVEDL